MMLKQTHAIFRDQACCSTMQSAVAGSQPVTPTWRTHQAEAVVITPNKSRRFPEADANPLEVSFTALPDRPHVC